MKFIKKCSVALTLAALFVAGPAAALPLSVGDSVNVSDQTGGAFGPGGWYQSVNYKLNGVDKSSHAGVFVLDYKHVAPVPTSTWTQFLSFCLEPDVFLTPFSNPYSVNSVTGANGGEYAPVSAKIAELWGRYRAIVDTAQEAAAFQLAIWELGYDKATDLDNGNFRMNTASGAGALAKSWLTSLDGTGPMAKGLVILVNNPNMTDRQDLITQIPEPGTLALLGLGLLGAGLARRQQLARG